MRLIMKNVVTLPPHEAVKGMALERKSIITV